MVSVEGRGSTEASALADAQRRAIEEVSGIVVISSLEANKKKLIKEEMANYSAGYIDRYEITSTTISKTEIIVEANVWVKPSIMANYKVNSGKDQKVLDGNRLGTQIDSYLSERGQADNLFSNILNDYPHKAFNIKQGPTEFHIDTDRTLIISIPFEIGWDWRYVNSLKEAMYNVGRDTRTEYRVAVALKKNPKDWLTDVRLYYLNDRDLYLKITNTLAQPPGIRATIYDDENRPIYTQCNSYRGEFTGDNRYNAFFITGNSGWQSTFEIKVRGNSELRQRIKSASKIEISAGNACPN
jgi:hypothetical protein